MTDNATRAGKGLVGLNGRGIRAGKSYAMRTPSVKGLSAGLDDRKKGNPQQKNRQFMGNLFFSNNIHF